MMAKLVYATTAFIAFFVGRGAASESISNLIAIARANNAMALNLYAQLGNRPGNLIFSPISIGTSLAAACAGAHGQTGTQISQALHISADRINDFGSLLKQLEGAGKQGAELNMGMSLWVQNKYPLSVSFEELVERHYGATVNRIDFTGWPGSFDSTKASIARAKINRWIADQTHSESADALSPALPNANTRLIFANTIYFKGVWATTFDKSQTKTSPFYVTSKNSTPVSLMHKRDRYAYRKDAELKMLEIPYRANRVSMVILLPTVRDGLASLERNLTAQFLNRLPITGEVMDVDVFLPKFTETCKFDLKAPLENIGIRDAFSETDADFSGIASEKSFSIDSFLHAATIDVNEDGAEASAAAVSSYDTIGGPARFVADHPFLFLIRENTTGAILFIGRITNPVREDKKPEGKAVK
jgi:serpin B